VIERLAELAEDLRWGSRRAWRRLRGGPVATGRLPSSAVLWRGGLVALVLALYALFRFVPLPGLSCDASPAKSCAATDHAIALVPADAGAYLHIDLDRESDQVRTAEAVAGRLPHFEAIEQGIFSSLGIAPGVDLRRDIGPWLGDEAAIAEVGGRRPQLLALLAIADREAEQAFLAQLGPGQAGRVDGKHAGLRVLRNGLAFAELHGFLALGSESAVRAAIATGQDRLRALSDSDQAAAMRDSLPDERLADLYISSRGIQRLLVGQGGLVSQLDTFTDFGASRGIAAALVAHDDGLELRVDSALDPGKAKASPSFFSAFPSFHPSLAGSFPADTLLYVDIGDPAHTVRALLRQARTAAPGLVAAFDRFRRKLRRSGVDIFKDVLPVLGGEAALGVAQGPAGLYLTLVFKDVDEDRAREQMARLQAPLIAALKPARTGQAPSFGAKRLGDTVVRIVRLTPAVDLAYAIFDGKLAVSTSLAGVREAVQGSGGIGAGDSFQTATSAASGGVSALVFLNLEALVRSVKPLGLEQIVGGFSADIARLKALGLTVNSDDEDLKTTLFLQIE
jgi:Protein of unknown function (DUF3352)